MLFLHNNNNNNNNNSKWIVIHVNITGVETIQRQTRAAYGCFVAGQSPCARAYPTLYARSVCDGWVSE